jgi:phosphate transport system protein
MDVDENDLKGQIAEMGEIALKMLQDGVRALDKFDVALADQVIKTDDHLDELDVHIEQQTVRLLITRQPMAHDARLLTSGLKIISYLDRIGRHGYDISWITKNSTPGTHSEPWPILQEMDAKVEAMIRGALDAYKSEDVEAARNIYRADDAVDALDRKVLEECVAMGTRGSKAKPTLFDYVRVSRGLERAADNACKIAEKTIYIHTGQRRRDYLGPGKHLLT